MVLMHCECKSSHHRSFAGMAMERGTGRAAGAGRKWAVELCDATPSASSRDVPDPLGFSRSSLDLVSVYTRILV